METELRGNVRERLRHVEKVRETACVSPTEVWHSPFSFDCLDSELANCLFCPDVHGKCRAVEKPLRHAWRNSHCLLRHNPQIGASFCCRWWSLYMGGNILLSYWIMYQATSLLICWVLTLCASSYIHRCSVLLIIIIIIGWGIWIALPHLTPPHPSCHVVPILTRESETCSRPMPCCVLTISSARKACKHSYRADGSTFLTSCIHTHILSFIRFFLDPQNKLAEIMLSYWMEAIF